MAKDKKEKLNEEYKDIRQAEDTTSLTDLVTVNIAYYRNGKGGIGLFTWCDDVVLVDLEDYQARKVKKCVDCGTITDEKKCPKCGGKQVRNVGVWEMWEYGSMGMVKLTN